MDRIVIDGIDKKCPCCDMTNLDQFKDMFDHYDTSAQRHFEYQQKTRDYSNEIVRVQSQSKADILKWVIERLEGRGGCL